MILEDLIVSVDLRGCPNRCSHCWLGHAPNPCHPEGVLREVAEAFRPYTRELEVSSWYREPDYGADYRELWALEQALSTHHVPHFELCSFYRLVRDAAYAPWLYDLGVREMQLTFFGGEALTDRYVGRPGAYRELLRSLDILLEHGIAPRIQVFVNGETLPELPLVEQMLQDTRLDARCADLGRPFHFFLHTGSCGGANRNHYDHWLTAQDIPRIPEDLLRRTLAYFSASAPFDVFGRPEGELLAELSNLPGPVGDIWNLESAGNDAPVLYVDGSLNAYPNLTAPSPAWCLGNVRRDGAASILRAYLDGSSPAQRALAALPVRALAAYGQAGSRRLFSRDDYVDLLFSRYLDAQQPAEHRPPVFPQSKK